VISAVGVAATILLFAPLAAYIPRACLAGILVLTAFRMTEIAALTYLVRATKFDAWILAITALSAVLISVEFCILIGVMLSFALYITKAARIAVTELKVTDHRVIREVQPGDQQCDLIRIYNFEGELFFGCAPEFERLLESIEERCSPSMRVIILRLKRARNPDAVCMKVLESFIRRVQSRGAVVMLTGITGEFTEVLANVGILELVGASNAFREGTDIWESTIQALQRAYQLLNNDRCNHCTQGRGFGHAVDWSYMI
jgi:SulP family sulfate permease